LARRGPRTGRDDLRRLDVPEGRKRRNGVRSRRKRKRKNRARRLAGIGEKEVMESTNGGTPFNTKMDTDRKKKWASGQSAEQKADGEKKSGGLQTTTPFKFRINPSWRVTGQSVQELTKRVAEKWVKKRDVTKKGGGQKRKTFVS